MNRVASLCRRVAQLILAPCELLIAPYRARKRHTSVLNSLLQASSEFGRERIARENRIVDGMPGLKEKRG